MDGPRIGYRRSMKVVVVGATGNVGTSVVAALAAEPRVDEIVGVEKRPPDLEVPKVTWMAVDISADPLDDVVAGADVVVHVAWLLQPSHDERLLQRTNVAGTARLVAAMVRNRVPALVYASSVGTYAPGPVGVRVDESWPSTGVPTSQYSRQKAAVERLLDQVEQSHPELRVVRLRKALIFKPDAASEIKRFFLGPLAPTQLAGRVGLPFVPDDERLAFQTVHTKDVAEAYRLAVLSDASGAYNIAAEPVITPVILGQVLGAQPVGISPALLRAGAAVTYAARLLPAEPGWIDLAVNAPLMSTEKARIELGWQPVHSAVDTLEELFAGFARGAGMGTPPLVPEGAEAEQAARVGDPN